MGRAVPRPVALLRPWVLAALLLCAVLPRAAGAQPTAAAPHVIDGPSSDITGLGGFSAARDGTGGLAYLKNVGGIQHVFVSRLLGGVFQAPQQIDVTLSGASTQPVIAAGNGGLLLVGFINAGQLYVVSSAGSSSALSAPADIFAGAANPAISISTFGKAYLAFTAAGSGGDDVRCAYYYNGQWGLEGSALDANPADDAGTASGRPSVTSAGDGVGIVAWGEAGHVFTRKVWGTSPSIVYEEPDIPSIGGWNEVSADEPAVSAGGDSSYAAVVFHEKFASGSQTQSRVLMQRLHGSTFDSLSSPDALGTPGTEGADQPQVISGEYGEGFVLSDRTQSNQLVAMELNQNESPAGVQRVDSLQNAAPPVADMTPAGFHAALIAWQEDPGSLGTPEIRARYFDGTTLEPEQVLSTPLMGPTRASAGLLTAADIAADVGVVWVQGSGSSTKIVAAQMYQPPGSFGPLTSFQYLRTTTPVLSWSSSRELWGPLRYDVTLDGVSAGSTTGTSLAVPNATFPTAPGQGPHTWQVSATNPAGQARSAKAAQFFIDTVPPVLTASVSGKLRVGSPMHVTVRYTDAPPPLPAADASGVASVQIKFGDGASYLVRHGKFHVYHHARRYKITVIVTDKAGNSTTTVTRVKIKAKPKPKKKKKSKGTHRHG